jgi:transposase-like protein
MRVKRGTRGEVRDRWRKRLARWRRLGCSITEFCEREGISQPSFFKWRRRLADERSSLDRPRVGPAFVPIEVLATHGRPTIASDALDDGWMQIRLGTVELRVPVTMDEASLRRLVRVVREETGAC